MSFTGKYLSETAQIIQGINQAEVEECVAILRRIRDRGRLFIIGVGGSAANASHAVNDFRKIGRFEAYAPTDNVAELTARTNDEGWETIFSQWLQGSRLGTNDCVMVLSVGGGSDNVSPNILNALRYARSMQAQIIGIVGRTGGATREYANASILIPTVNPDHITPHTESFHAVLWHLMVNHPLLK